MSNITNNEWQGRVDRLAARLVTEVEELYDKTTFLNTIGMGAPAWSHFKKGTSII